MSRQCQGADSALIRPNHPFGRMRAESGRWKRRVMFECSGADGFKSYAVSFILQDKDKTLNDKQIESTMAKIQKILETQLGAKIRG